MTEENVIRRHVWKVRFEAGEVSARLATPSPLSGFVAFGKHHLQQQRQQRAPELVGAPPTGKLSRVFDVSRSRSRALHTLRRRAGGGQRHPLFSTGASASASATSDTNSSAAATAASSGSGGGGAARTSSSQSAVEIAILEKARRRIKKERKKLKARPAHCPLPARLPIRAIAFYLFRMLCIRTDCIYVRTQVQ